MLPCSVWHTVEARHRTKKIRPSVESSLRPTADLHALRQLRQQGVGRRLRGRGRGRRRGGEVRASATWMCAPLLHPVGISIFFDLELRFEFFFLCALPRPCGGAWRSFFEKV